jgi:hypothetical protein
MNNAWAVVAAALGSSALTIVGSFWLEVLRSKKSQQSARSSTLNSACVQLNSRAIMFALRVQSLHATAIERSGPSEGINVVLHIRKPPEIMELTDWLMRDLGPMLEAKAMVESVGNQHLIKAAAEVFEAAATVLNVVQESLSSRQQPTGSSRSVLWENVKRLRRLQRDPEVERKTNKALRSLLQKILEFTQITRDQTGLEDPAAIVDAFHLLFDDGAQSDES